MATRVIRDRRQGFGQLRFGGNEDRREVGYIKAYARMASARADPTSASTLLGSAANARSKKLCA
jgi:hypothetical protein